MSPIDNLAVRVVAIFGTEWRPADQALEHDGSQTPPIAVKAVSVAGKDLGCDVVRGSDGGVRHQPSTPTPVVDLRTVGDGQVDLVDGDRVTIAWTVGLALQQLLVVVVIVELVEAC